MRWLDLAQASTGSLRANPLRSALTALGVIFGVSSVVIMMAIGEGTQRRIQEEIEKIGTNLIIVRPGTALAAGVRLGAATRPTITEDDAAAILADTAQVAVTAPLVGGAVQVTNGQRNWTTPMLGVTSDFFTARNWRVTDGENLFAEDERGNQRRALIGRTVADKLFDVDPIGATIRVNHLPFKIVGMLESKGQTLGGTDLDDTVMVALPYARDNILGRPSANARSVGTIIVKVADAESVREVFVGVQELLRQRHQLREGQQDDFELSNMAEALGARADLSSAMTRFLAAVASISLLVGGIGIMNIMLVSVTERTTEIGLRMAVGATPGNILVQFLAEAVVISAVGGTIGAGVGLGGASLAHAYLGYQVVLTLEPVALAFVFSVAIGVIFGVYPAWRASKQSPVESLRRGF